MTTIKDYSTELACALNGYRALIVPNLHNSQFPHWQSLWEQTIPRTNRIRIHDWHNADWVKWRNSIIASLISIDEPVVLIAEGFGALAAASVAAEYPGKIIAAFFVDPADPDTFDVRKKIPKQSLPISTKIVIRKHTDTNAALLAALWNTDLSYASATDPNHESSFLDYWPDGVRALKELIGKTHRKADEMTQARTKKILTYLRYIQQTQQAKPLRCQGG
jgi:predicted alpha/beta hydrolase family esterase